MRDTSAAKKVAISAWKFSWKTAKKLNLDRTQTCQDQKFQGLQKTVTTVQSSVDRKILQCWDWEKTGTTGLN